VRLTPAQWIELSTDGLTDFGAIGTVTTNPGVQGKQEDTLQTCLMLFSDFRQMRIYFRPKDRCRNEPTH
jgi:hypothetical protein